MSACYIPLYQGDYLRDTGHLSTLEHGAYLLLLMHYYNAGSLPGGDERLARVTKLSMDEWLAIRPTMQSFFYNGWKHKRVEQELKKQRNQSERGQAGAEARWGPCERPMTGAERVRKHREKHPCNVPVTLPQAKPYQEEGKTESIARDGRSSDRPSLSVAAAFDEFWQRYPHKMGKGAAHRSFVRIAKSKKVHFSEIMAGLDRYIRDKPQDLNWCYPATWLNQERWCDQPAVGTTSAPSVSYAEAWKLRTEQQIKEREEIEREREA